MIRFFRTLRQQMLSEGRIKNYLLYAVGEIALVVIGILIALQINNWSEQYKDQQLEQSYYCKLLEDVNQDRLLLEQLIAENEVRIENNNKLLHLLQQENPSRKEVIQSMRETITKIRFRFRPSLSAFDDLKSSGKLNILKDLNVKKQLLNYYAIMEGYGDLSDIIGDASIAVFHNVTKDFREIGFQDIFFVRDAIDTALVEIDRLQTPNYPSPQLRKQLMSDAVFHMNNNGRKRELYKTIAAEIDLMKMVLLKKCPNLEASKR